jgi:hypothetical protein
MKARNWNSIIIAEQILNTKPVRSVSYVNYMRKTTNDGSYLLASNQSESYNDENNFNFVENTKFYLGNDEETAPQQRFFAPPHAATVEPSKNDETEGMPDWLKKDMEDADFIPIEALENKMKSLNHQDIESQVSNIDITRITVCVIFTCFNNFLVQVKYFR